MIIAAFVGWYQLSFQMPGVTTTLTFLPGSSESEGCSGANCSTVITSATVTYSSLNQNSTGAMYAAVEGLCLVGALAAGVAGAYTILTPSDRPGRLRYGTGLTVLGTLLAFAAPILVAVGQPSALTADVHGGVVPQTGPWVSFIGSDTARGTTLSWGPTYGWYLALAAGVVLLISAVLMGRKYMAQRAMENPEEADPSAYGGDPELYGSSGPYQAPEVPGEPAMDPSAEAPPP